MSKSRLPSRWRRVQQLAKNNEAATTTASNERMPPAQKTMALCTKTLPAWRRKEQRGKFYDKMETYKKSTSNSKTHVEPAATKPRCLVRLIEPVIIADSDDGRTVAGGARTIDTIRAPEREDTKNRNVETASKNSTSRTCNTEMAHGVKKSSF